MRYLAALTTGRRTIGHLLLLLLLMLMLLLVYYRSPQGTDTTWATCQSTYGGGEKSSEAERFSSASIPGDPLLL